MTLVPTIIATSILVGLITFLVLKILPQHAKYLDDLGCIVPVGDYRGLDLLLCGLVVAVLGSVAYAWFVRRRLKNSLQPLWSMRLHVGAVDRVCSAAVCIAWLLFVCCAFASLRWSGYRMLGSGMGLFVSWWSDVLTREGGLFLLPLATSLPLVLQSARRALRPDLAECRAYPEGIVSAGGGFFPWEWLYAYAWKPDHLELKMPNDKIRAAIENNPHGFKFGITLRVIVPPHQREMVEAFLAERLATARD